MSDIKQVLKYEFNGVLYNSASEAESKAIDDFGEFIDWALQTSGLPNFRYRQGTINFVEHLWANKEKMCNLLAVKNKSINLCECECEINDDDLLF